MLAAKENDFKLQPKDIVFISEPPWVVAEDIFKLALSSFATSVSSTWVTLNVDPILTSQKACLVELPRRPVLA